MINPVPEDSELNFRESLPELRRWEEAMNKPPTNLPRRIGIAAIDPPNHDLLVESFHQAAIRFGASIRERPSFEYLIGASPNPRAVPWAKRFSPVVVEAACSRDRALWSLLIAGGEKRSFVIDVQASRYVPTMPRSQILDMTALPLVRTAVAVGMERHEAFSGAAYMFVACARDVRFRAATEIMLSPRAFSEAEEHLALAAVDVRKKQARAPQPLPLGVQRVPPSILLWHALQVVACDVGPMSQIVGIHRMEILPKHTLQLEVALHDPVLGGITLAEDQKIDRVHLQAVNPSSVTSVTRRVRFGLRDPGSFAFAECVA